MILLVNDNPFLKCNIEEKTKQHSLRNFTKKALLSSNAFFNTVLTKLGLIEKTYVIVKELNF